MIETMRGGRKRKVDVDDNASESPFYGFEASDIPQPIVIKTEPDAEDGDDCVIVEVTRATKSPLKTLIKKEKVDDDDDDLDTFHGFTLDDLPKPIVIKEEPVDDKISVERAESTIVPDVLEKNADPPSDTTLSVSEAEDQLLDELETVDAEDADKENNTNNAATVSAPIIPTKVHNKPVAISPQKVKNQIIKSPKKPIVPPPTSQVTEQTDNTEVSAHFEVTQDQDGAISVVTQPSQQTKAESNQQSFQDIFTQEIVDLQSQRGSALPRKIQIIDENGEKIELITQENDGEFDLDNTDEDHEFTVIVEDNEDGEVTNITRDIHNDSENNGIEGSSVEDIFTQFESETSSAAAERALQRQKELEEEAQKRRKRNIDLIAKETALLGRKAIQPEKYYDMPLENDELEDEMVEDELIDDGLQDEFEAEDEPQSSPSPAKVQKPSNDGPKLPCGMGGCDKMFDSKGSLKRHRTEAHPELEEFKPVELEVDDAEREAGMTVACPVCERKFRHKNTCTVHIKTNHLGWSKPKLFECPECLRAFDNKKAMEAHREAVHLGIRTVCPLCDKAVTRLDLHVRMVHTDHPEWPCPDCGKKFKRKFDLNRHRVTVHLGVRNFPCDLCGKRFADMKDMTRHRNAVHYGMKIKWNSRKYKEKKGQLKQRKNAKEDSVDYTPKKRGPRKKDLKVDESNVTYIETLETTEEEIIAIEGLEGGTVILENGAVLQSHLEAVKGNPGEPQVFIEADPDGHGAYRFVVMTEEEAGTVLGAADTVEVA